MKNFKKISLALVFSILLLAPGCKDKISDRDGNILEYSLSGAKDREGYFVRVENSDGSVVFQPLLDPSKAGYVSYSGSFNIQRRDVPRFIMMCEKDNLIPVITGNNMLIYIDDDSKIPAQFELEKFTDCGFTFGCTFSTADDEAGLKLKSGSGKNFVDDSSMKDKFGSKSHLELYTLDNIGGYQIGAKNVDSNGVFQGLEKGKGYKFSCFVGTKYEEIKVVADTHYFKSEKNIQMNQIDCISLTTNGFAIISLPSNLETGYYILNGEYMFYFDAEHLNNSPLTDRFEIVTSETDPSNAEATTSETVTPGLIRDGDGEEDYDIPGDSIADPGEGSDPTNE